MKFAVLLFLLSAMIENVGISTFHSIQNSVENMREKSLKSKKILYILPISDLHIKIFYAYS